jgi:plastocyanin
MNRPFAAAVLLASLVAAPLASSQDTREVALTIQANRFSPEQVTVKAGAPFVLIITNQDPGSEEFESKALRIEKIIPGNRTVRLKMPALKAGAYAFVGEYHEATARGRIVAE